MSLKEGQSLNISRSNSRYMSRRFCGTVKKFGLNNLQAELNLSTNIHPLEETSISIPDLCFPHITPTLTILLATTTSSASEPSPKTTAKPSIPTTTNTSLSMHPVTIFGCRDPTAQRIITMSLELVLRLQLLRECSRIISDSRLSKTML